MNTQKSYLMDVVAMRLSLIFLLIVYHALCIYTGGWNSPFSPAINIPTYKWLGRLINLNQMEALCFISGLLLGYSAINKSDALSFHSCILKKAKRLLLPCLCFGVISCAMFYDLREPWYNIIWTIINGYGHLWFLPMLFWCFVLIYLIENALSYFEQTPNCIKSKIVLFIALCVTIINPLKHFPLGLGTVCGFFLYFYIGFCIKTKRFSFPATTRTNIVIAIITFAVSFSLFRVVNTYLYGAETFVEKAIGMVMLNLFHTTNALSAIYIMYSFANKKSVLSHLANKPILVTLSGYCYGVYIYQQFILMLLYYYTQLPFVVSAYWLPWIATTITLIVSLGLCHITLKTKLGRFLIG